MRRTNQNCPTCGFKGNKRFFCRRFVETEYKDICLVCDVGLAMTEMKNLEHASIRNMENCAGRMKRLTARINEAKTTLKLVSGAQKSNQTYLNSLKKKMRYEKNVPQPKKPAATPQKKRKPKR